MTQFHEHELASVVSTTAMVLDQLDCKLRFQISWSLMFWRWVVT